MSQPQRDVTHLLVQWRDGDQGAFEQLLPIVYEELRRLARHHLWHERSGHTMATTDLVHEAYLNLVGQDQTPWQDRAHFFAVAARVMRHVLIDYARRRSRAKRGGQQHQVSLDQAAIVSEDHFEELIAIDQALTRLTAVDKRLCRIVECRYFGGLSIAETANALDVSPATVKRDWTVAKAWLHRELYDGE